MNVVVGALAVLVLIQAFMIVGLLRSHAEILRRLQRLDGGEELDGRASGAAPPRHSTRVAGSGPNTPRTPVDIAGPSLTDDVSLVRVAGAGHRTLLAFLSSTCGTCRAFWDAFAAGEHDMLPADVRLVVVAQSEPDEDRAALAELASDDVTVVLSSEAWIDYGVQGSPYVVLVDPVEGVQGEGTGMTFTQVRRLLAQSTGDIGFLGRAERDPLDASLPGAKEWARAGLGKDDAVRIDAELSAAGLRPGDPALYGVTDPEGDAR